MRPDHAHSVLPEDQRRVWILGGCQGSHAWGDRESNGGPRNPSTEGGPTSGHDCHEDGGTDFLISVNSRTLSRKDWKVSSLVHVAACYFNFINFFIHTFATLLFSFTCN